MSIYYNEKRYPTRALCVEIDGNYTDVLTIGPTSLLEDITDEDYEPLGERERELMDRIYYFLEDHKWGLTDEELLEEMGDKRLTLVNCSPSCVCRS